MNRRQILLPAAALLVGLGVGLGAAAPRREPEPVLHTAQGLLRMSDLRGQVGVVYFGFATCPDVCPTALSRLGAALSALSPDDLARVRPVFVSLDPGRDTPERLATYVGLFHPAIVGATSTPAALRRLTDAFHVRWERVPVESALEYVIDHESVITVLAPDGTAVARLTHGADPAAIRGAIEGALHPTERSP